MPRNYRSVACTLVLVIASTLPVAAGQPVDVARLAEQLTPFLKCVAGQRTAFALAAEIDVPDGSRKHHVSIQLDRIDADAFDLEIKHTDYWVRLQRRAGRTAMVLPLHKVAFVGDGAVEGLETLKPEGISQRLFSPESLASMYLPMVSNGEPQVAALMLTTLLKLEYDEKSGGYSHKGEATFQFHNPESAVSLRIGNAEARIAVRDSDKSDKSPIALEGMKIVTLDRADLDRCWVRGVRRALEVLAPSPLLTSPAQKNRSVPHGELRWIDGHRVALLQGSPEQIGRAHGLLLKAEAQRCVDSVLYAFGIAQTINSGRWFQHDLQAAYQRLRPHIPDDHKTETIALAKAVGVNPELGQFVNVFPELFHCSGFAVFGKATKDGKLYHGRVLDYMTTIGLQDSAVTFIIAVDGKIPFANVGYAGLVGSVSGMNANAISLGEMGGGGEGKWDGVPMTTLMRRALEECNTLQEVKNLWQSSPRTCEYFYVFADGKTNEAVGVAATPESVQFIQPGQTHPLLGDGIPDAVVLSAGSRLETLRARVQERYGQIDAGVGQWLMTRPVAMSSNLHNVLFVPQDRVLFVAHADHRRVAAERPYVRLDLNELLGSMKR